MPPRVIEPLPDQPFKTVTLRLPVELHTLVSKLAKEERRTLHGQLLLMLERALQAADETEEIHTRGR